MKQASFFPTLVPPIYPLLTLCILFFSFLVRESLGGDNQPFLACSMPKSCGDGQNIRFPFYIKGKQEAYCGHPGFELSCNTNGQPTLKLSNTNYTLHEIFYQNQTLRVSNTDFSNSALDCIPPTNNISVPNLRFDLVPGQTNLSLLYNCSNSSLLHGLPRLDNRCYGGNKTSLVVASPEVNRQPGELSKVCATEVVAPVEAYGGTSDGLRGALENGFWLKWKASNCSLCEASGGVCGFNNFTYRSKCFCPGGTRLLRCYSGQFSLARFFFLSLRDLLKLAGFGKFNDPFSLRHIITSNLGEFALNSIIILSLRKKKILNEQDFIFRFIMIAEKQLENDGLPL